MNAILVLLATLATPPAPEGPTTKDAAKALTALDQIHAANGAIEKACIKAYKAREALPDRPMPHLSPEMNREIRFWRGWVSKACPGGDNR